MTLKYFLNIIIVVAVIVGGFFILNNHIYKEKQGTGVVTEPYRATLTGVQTCLPHKDTSRPQTLECAIGMQTDAGEYYALDFAFMSQIPPEIENGQRFTASGTITPIERLSSDHWQKYDIEGIFSVTDSVVVEGKTEAPTFTWKFEKAKSLNLDGNPNTNIFLEAKYANGKIDTKLIDTSAGSCNELPDADSDTLTGTANIQCYYAGAGERYKITKGEKSYFVERQTFEEGSPDYNPPEQRYEIVIEFPL